MDVFPLRIKETDSATNTCAFSFISKHNFAETLSKQHGSPPALNDSGRRLAQLEEQESALRSQVLGDLKERVRALTAGRRVRWDSRCCACCRWRIAGTSSERR